MSKKESIFNSNEENIQLINKNDDKFKPKFGIFKLLDYDLNLEERKMKFKEYDRIICEDCNQEIEKSNFICYNCYNKETDCNEQNRMNYGICKFCFKSNASFGCCKIKIFKSSDYDLNLEERKLKYKDCDIILCEKCNREIDKLNYYCYDCTNFNFGIFKISDYNLNLKERKLKYEDCDGILCEKCSQKIDKQDFYCIFCYVKETDCNKKGQMKYGSNFGIFNTLDYNLNLEERKVKYKDYDGILCEECNQEINKQYLYCFHCYSKETDSNKKGNMTYGTSKVGIFQISDYDLNLEERKEKYNDYDNILCEGCNQEIDKQYYYCNYCYNDIEGNGECKVCSIGNNDDCCSIYEFQQYLENFNKWISENKIIDIKRPIVEISDYDLDEDDRQEKYKNCDYILCENCGKKHHYNYCYYCYDEEMKELEKLISRSQPKLRDYEVFYSKVYNKKTKELKELKELQSILKDYENIYFKLEGNLGIFKQIMQQFENTKYDIDNKKIHINNIRYNTVNNCDRKLRSYCDCYDNEINLNEKKRMEFGKCKDCSRINEDLNDCLFCKPERFQRDFNKWTSGNKIIDKLIQDNQRIAVEKYDLLLEWIPFNKFTNIKYIAEGGFAKVYSATWIDGQIKKWSQLNNNWRRNGPLTIALKILNDSENVSDDFLNELNFFNKVSGCMCIIKCFGITQDPITHNYALVLQYMENGNLRSYLGQTANSKTWEQRLNKMYDICLALNDIHKYGLIHKDLHPGNIFIGSTFAYIGDFGFCMPANECLSNSTEKNIYGVIPYIAPEILRRKPHTLASDIYSLGIIINEIITGIPPFNKQPHDHLLVLDVCRGLRPNIRAETPNSLRELIEKCWDANPENRPTSKEIFYTLSNNLNEYKNMLLNFNETITMQSYETHPQAIYTSRLLISQNLNSNLPEPINCPNQQEFVSSEKLNTLNSECLECEIII
ncbi:kinase-like protein [Rhizophagus irregularis]|uniref:Kinase-like protein n=1 Tax=Rhizophagus irregularis TaxID=588596 RepID=A0A2N0Q810_9GLOM|nr:kinase-like protein [Rhizophagus irregularis]